MKMPSLPHFQPPPPPLPPPLSPPPPPPPPQLKFAQWNLIANSDDYIDVCIPLYEASITGDWNVAKVILDEDLRWVRSAITKNGETALHVAASAEETMLMEHFVGNLVNLMSTEDLELRNKNRNTAFYLACAAGNLKLAKIMMKSNPKLQNIPGYEGKMPLYVSALMGKYSTVKYLYDASDKLSGDYWTKEKQAWLLQQCVECEFFDVALQIVRDHQELAQNASSVLTVLARKPHAFNRAKQKYITRTNDPTFRSIHTEMAPVEDDTSDALELLKIICKDSIIPMSANQILDIVKGRANRSASTNEHIKNQNEMLFVAAEMGNTRFVVELLRANPDLICQKNDDGISIFHMAVMHRHRGIFNLLYEIGSMKDLILPLTDTDGNNMLHLVGKTSKKMRSRTSGASLLMQRELLWFKEVEKMMPPSYRERKNNTGETPYQLFSEESRDLVYQGLKWMKDCIVVATLIVTVAFAVAFTVPGGYNQETGIPIFVHGTSFLVFVIADAISLFTSSVSLLVFLSVLISRHRERDFMYSLPMKLMTGLTTLIISVAAMMITFSASFFVLYHVGLKWVPILIATFAAVPVFIFGQLQFPLLLDMYRSIYDSQYLFKPKKRMLYHTNPRF